MPLLEKITENDVALLTILEDEIWLGEFLRRTANAEVDTTLWPKGEPFEYRWYQKDFLTDKTTNILFTGGRSIGKCQPLTARVYTNEGYKTIRELKDKPYFIVYALDGTEVIQRRAICKKDSKAHIYKITTTSGNKIECTGNHPILTDKGYVLAELLTENDIILTATNLPWESTRKALEWYELRWLGYTILNKPFRSHTSIKMRYKQQEKEIEYIADTARVIWHKNEQGYYTLYRRKGIYKHPFENMLIQFKLAGASDLGLKSLPDVLMQECLDNIRVFLEALFSQFADIGQREISITVPTEKIALQLKELLLRFGIESIPNNIRDRVTKLSLLDYRAVYRFWNNFNLPGVMVSNLPQPPQSNDIYSFARYDQILNIVKSETIQPTYAIQVYENYNYISEDIFVHNSIILEDKIVYETINNDIEFPVTSEEVLVTANQNQMTPILDRLISRFTQSPLLKPILNNNINRSKGTMDFNVTKRTHRLNARIAGSRGENNMVGLHQPRIRADEVQIFPLGAWQQLMPTLNQWEPKTSIIAAGVPNSLRNTVLYQLDKRSPRYKKYHIPSHNNPYYTREDDIDNIKRYGGEESDAYQNLVLGRHGTAAFQVIPRESITVLPYEFNSFRYTSGDKLKGNSYKDKLDVVDVSKDNSLLVFSIDTGFVDPTVIQVLVQNSNGIWRTRIRYKLTRIDFSEQELIIDYLADFYNPARIAIDIGAGGGGSGIMHNLTNRQEYARKNYASKFVPILFNENLISGFDTEGNELIQDAKSYAGNELAKMIESGALVFSEFDIEGISQVERISKQKSLSGKDRYFVLSDKGSGASEDDHIFASYVCFILGIRTPITQNIKKQLGKALGGFSK